jgi:hypothetical protein
MQISANNLLQAAQQALAAKPTPQPPAPQSFEPMSFAPDASAPEPQASAQGTFQRPGSQVDIRI